MKDKEEMEFPPVDWPSFSPYPVIGVDEVGRGSLAGPVYAAAAIISFDFSIVGVTDSKLISEKRREELALQILATSQVGIGFASVKEIERLNIFHASLLAMQRAVKELRVGCGHVLVDGKHSIPGLGQKFKQTALIKGDLRALPISAASIVAKTTRDAVMRGLHLDYPEYDFVSNKGYGCQTHRDAIERWGPTKHHRLHFSGVWEFKHKLRNSKSKRSQEAASAL